MLTPDEAYRALRLRCRDAGPSVSVSPEEADALMSIFSQGKTTEEIDSQYQILTTGGGMLFGKPVKVVYPDTQMK